MTSKIINMADRMKDAEDRLLEAMFETTPIADNGFSVRIVRRIRRRLWVRRLALPIALLLGGSIAFRPVLQLLDAAATLTSVLPGEWAAMPLDRIPQLPVVLMGAALLAVAMLTARMLEE